MLAELAFSEADTVTDPPDIDAKGYWPTNYLSSS